jgi:hypothetical protein
MVDRIQTTLLYYIGNLKLTTINRRCPKSQQVQSVECSKVAAVCSSHDREDTTCISLELPLPYVRTFHKQHLLRLWTPTTNYQKLSKITPEIIVIGKNKTENPSSPYPRALY